MDSSKCHYRSSTTSYRRKLHQLVHEMTFPSKREYYSQIKKEYPVKAILGILLLVTILFSFLQSSLLSNLKCACEVEESNVNCEQPINLVPPGKFQNVTDTLAKINCSDEVYFSQEEEEGEHSEKISSSHSHSQPAPIKHLPSKSVLESHSIKKQLERSELIWQRSVRQRHAWISRIGKDNISSVNPWDGENYVFFWNYFPPSFNCPHSVQRVGFIGDGGKWLCGLELYDNESPIKVPGKQPCIIYSFGVANESSFEGEMLRRTDCLVFAYDYSVKSIGSPVEPTNPRVTFKALGIGNKNLGKFRTLKYLMEKNGHGWIDILKMDIEGGEYAALNKVMEDFPSPEKTLPFGQLLLEVHVEGKIFPKFFHWWERLEARGMRAFSSEVNHVACAIASVKPNFVEYSFLNVYGQHRLVVDSTSPFASMN